METEEKIPSLQAIVSSLKAIVSSVCRIKMMVLAACIFVSAFSCCSYSI